MREKRERESTIAGERSDPVVPGAGVRRGVHVGDGVEDVVDVVAEVEYGVGDDRLGGGDAG